MILFLSMELWSFSLFKLTCVNAFCFSSSLSISSLINEVNIFLSTVKTNAPSILSSSFSVSTMSLALDSSPNSIDAARLLPIMVVNFERDFTTSSLFSV